MKVLILVCLLLTACGGSTGPAGVKGDQGIQGQTGLQGPIGNTGPQGPQGFPGVNATPTPAPVLPSIQQQILGKFSLDATWDITVNVLENGVISFPNESISCIFNYISLISHPGYFNYQVTFLMASCPSTSIQPFPNDVYTFQYLPDSCLNGLCGELILKSSGGTNFYLYGNKNL